MGLNGIDISSWHDDLVVGNMATCDFVIVKATAAAKLATSCSHSSFTTRQTASPRRSRAMRPSLSGPISLTFRFTPSLS